MNFFSFFCCFSFSFSSFSDHGDHGFQEENCRLVHGGLNQVVEWMQWNALQLILLEGGDRTNLESNFMTNLLFVISFSSKNKYSRILHVFMPYRLNTQIVFFRNVKDQQRLSKSWIVIWRHCTVGRKPFRCFVWQKLKVIQRTYRNHFVGSTVHHLVQF